MTWNCTMSPHQGHWSSLLSQRNLQRKRCNKSCSELWDHRHGSETASSSHGWVSPGQAVLQGICACLPTASEGLSCSHLHTLRAGPKIILQAGCSQGSENSMVYSHGLEEVVCFSRHKFGYCSSTHMNCFSCVMGHTEAKIVWIHGLTLKLLFSFLLENSA